MRITFKNSHFLIEGPGKAMDLIQDFIAERRKVIARNKQLCDELGVTKYSFDRETGVISGVIFKDAPPPPDWRKPGRNGISSPKKGTDWHKRLKNQVGHRNASDAIKETLGIPTSMFCTGANDSRHLKQIGHWFTPCQFATLGSEPPFLLIIPNVPYYVAEAEAEGLIVPDEVKAFKPEFEGCRHITREDWEIIQLQHKAATAKTEISA